MDLACYAGKRVSQSNIYVVEGKSELWRAYCKGYHNRKWNGLPEFKCRMIVLACHFNPPPPNLSVFTSYRYIVQKIGLFN